LRFLREIHDFLVVPFGPRRVEKRLTRTPALEAPQGRSRDPRMGGDAKGERQKRLAEALRANLKRRKAQQRERLAERPPTGRNETASSEETG
jgi:hypothetical protein